MKPEIWDNEKFQSTLWGGLAVSMVLLLLGPLAGIFLSALYEPFLKLVLIGPLLGIVWFLRTILVIKMKWGWVSDPDADEPT